MLCKSDCEQKYVAKTYWCSINTSTFMSIFRDKEQMKYIHQKVAGKTFRSTVLVMNHLSRRNSSTFSFLTQEQKPKYDFENWQMNIFFYQIQLHYTLMKHISHYQMVHKCVSSFCNCLHQVPLKLLFLCFFGCGGTNRYIWICWGHDFCFPIAINFTVYQPASEKWRNCNDNFIWCQATHHHQICFWLTDLLFWICFCYNWL